MSKWQPFETAPKDGSEFLAYREDTGVFSMLWHEASGPDDCFWATTFIEDLTGDLPTHWMPLPAGPEVAMKHRNAAERIGVEIQGIMQVYREQEADGDIDTPGGLEHMGDVWRMLRAWDKSLSCGDS